MESDEGELRVDGGAIHHDGEEEEEESWKEEVSEWPFCSNSETLWQIPLGLKEDDATYLVGI